MTMRGHHSGRISTAPLAFTLIELLVVIAIVGLLAGLVLPVLGRAKGKAQGILCVNNTKQLTLAWTMYAAAHEDRLVYNRGGDRTRRIAVTNWSENWVDNVMSWELDPDNTNSTFASKGKLSPYVGASPGLYHCPADHVLSDIQKRAGWASRARSVSMNAMVGDAGESMNGKTNLNNPGYTQFLRPSDISSPAGIFIFLEEHPDSINDGYFLNKADDPEWVDLPASYHDGAGCFSFADGHAEMHRWQEAATRRANKPDAAQLPFDVPAGARRDFSWVTDRMSIERW